MIILGKNGGVWTLGIFAVEGRSVWLCSRYRVKRILDENRKNGLCEPGYDCCTHVL